MGDTVHASTSGAGRVDGARAPAPPPIAAAPPALNSANWIDWIELFSIRFGDTRMAVTGEHELEIAHPAGPAPARGRQPVQHIVLRCKRDHRSVVIGSVNRDSNTVRLLSFDQVRACSRAGRRSRSVRIDRREFDRLAGDLMAFFGQQGLSVVSVTSPDRAPTTAIWWVAGALALASAATAVIALVG